MAKIRNAESMTRRQGEGWAEITLTEPGTVEGLPMSARRWIVQPHGRTPEVTHGNPEVMLYVIRGRGAVVVDDQRLMLEPETVLWLEPGDRYWLEAGTEGLEILQGEAPR